MKKYGWKILPETMERGKTTSGVAFQAYFSCNGEALAKSIKHTEQAGPNHALFDHIAITIFF
jgi:hypothetical protein